MKQCHSIKVLSHRWRIPSRTAVASPPGLPPTFTCAATLLGDAATCYGTIEKQASETISIYLPVRPNPLAQIPGIRVVRTRTELVGT
jgi:hypothetical protein